MKRCLILVLIVVTIGLVGGCHQDLTIEERMFGVSFRSVYDDFESREPDRVRRAINRFSYIEFQNAEPGSELEKNNKKVARTIMTIFARTLLKGWGYAAMDDDVLLRVEAARSIGRRPDMLTDEALEALVRKLDYREEPEKFVRIECARSLGNLHRPGTADPLVRAMHTDPEVMVRMTCARALAHFKTFNYDQPDYEIAVQGLIDALSDQQVGVRHEAVAALAQLTEQRFDSVQECIAWSRQRQPERPGD